MSEAIKDRFGRECFEYRGMIYPVAGFCIEKVQVRHEFLEKCGIDKDKIPYDLDERLSMHEKVKEQYNNDDHILRVIDISERKPLQWYCDENEKIHAYDYTDSLGNVYCGICKDVKADK